MNSKPFKFRHINRIAGAFLFLTVTVLAVLATLAAKSQQWFADVTEYRVEIPVGDPNDPNAQGGTMGIKAGSDVRVIGNQVGHVKSVSLCKGDELTPIRSFENVPLNDMRIVAVLSVKGDFSNFIGSDSRAVLKFDLGGLGAAYFDVSRGTQSFPVVSSDKKTKEQRVLEFGKEPDAKGEVFEIVARMEKEILPAIQSYKATADSATAFIEGLADENKALYKSLASLETGIADLNVVLAQAAKGDGALGDMISADSKMRTELNEFAVTLNSGTESLSDAIDNLNEGITELRETGIASINETAKSLPATVSQTKATIAGYDVAAKQMFETLREIEILTEGLQQHWLVKRNIEDPIEDPKPTEAIKRSSSGSKRNPATKMFKRR